MDANTLLADPAAIRLEHIVSQPASLVIVVTATRRQADCPKCQRISTRIHSRYIRQVADLPWQGVSVRLELHTRRFRCTNDLCERSIFCERLPSVVTHYARQTSRLTSALELIGFAIGGEAGARVAQELAMVASPDTLLRRIRRALPEEHPTPRVLGVDDWAFRRGHRYGTILVDLEGRRPVDLLPDREAGTLAAWLRAHPGVEVVSRDRACAYADGTAQGAPAAIQVADRWHLMKNMGETLQRLLERKHAVLRQAAQAVTATAATPAPMAEERCARLTAAPLPTLSEQARQHSRERRLARYHEVIALREQGTGVRAIARRLHLSRTTVRKLLRAGSFPEQAQRARRRSIVDPYHQYLKARWAEGCHNATTLWRELQAQGFRGEYSAVYRYLVHRLSGGLPTRRKRAPRVTTIKTPAARRTMWLLVGDEVKYQPDEQAFVARLLDGCPEVTQARDLARQFMTIMRERQADALDDWMTTVNESGLTELRGFVAGLRRDLAPVRAALTSEWSNGQTEGQVNRLKLIKRQMYGRANFDLLRQRVLHAV